MEGDTRIIPSFSVGWTYLVFLDRPYHVKAFEEVSGESDKWLAYVKNRIASQKDEATQIRNGAISRQIKYHVDKLLNGFPEIDKAEKISIIKRSYDFAGEPGSDHGFSVPVVRKWRSKAKKHGLPPFF